MTATTTNKRIDNFDFNFIQRQFQISEYFMLIKCGGR